MPTLTFHGHATFSIETDEGVHLVVDPFFTDNPSFDGSVDEVDADFVLLTHGHHDHIGAVVVVVGVVVVSPVVVVVVVIAVVVVVVVVVVGVVVVIVVLVVVR